MCIHKLYRYSHCIYCLRIQDLIQSIFHGLKGFFKLNIPNFPSYTHFYLKAHSHVDILSKDEYVEMPRKQITSDGISCTFKEILLSPSSVRLEQYKNSYGLSTEIIKYLESFHETPLNHHHLVASIVHVSMS